MTTDTGRGGGAASTTVFNVWTGNGTDLYSDGGLLIVLEVWDAKSSGANATFEGMIRAPPGVRVEEAENGSAIAGPITSQEYRLGLRAFASTVADYHFAAWIENMAFRGGSNRFGISKLINVTGNETNAAATVGPGPRLAFDLAFTGTNETNQAIVRIDSPVEVNATVVQSWPTTEGPRTWTGSLHAGLNEIRFVLLWPESGQRNEVFAAFEEIAAVYPDPVVSWGAAHDYVTIYNKDGLLVVADD